MAARLPKASSESSKSIGAFRVPASPGCKHFRVLTLEPGIADSPLDCKLKVVSVENARQSEYEALSYAWGNNDTLKPFISCHRKCLRLTSNLRSALCHIRSEKEVTTFWVDQICIHQEDLVERSQQVSLMSSIYSAAKRVIIWLGDADSTSHQAMTFVPVLYYNMCLHFESQGTDFFKNTPKDKQLEAPNSFSLGSNLHCGLLCRIFSKENGSRESG